MRRLLIRSVLSVLVLATLAVAWIVAGPWWARALDAIHTTRLATATSLSIRKYSGFFHFFPGRDGAPLPETEGFSWWDWGNPLERVGIQLDPGGVLVLIDGDRRFVLGRCPCAIEDHGYTPAIEAEPGDTTSITLDRGVASWPTPFHVTCCGSVGGGGSWYPWARYLYWHLSWTKADGARLDMLARFEQNYENGSGWNDPGAASLTRLDIRPARLSVGWPTAPCWVAGRGHRGPPMPQQTATPVFRRIWRSGWKRRSAARPRPGCGYKCSVIYGRHASVPTRSRSTNALVSRHSANVRLPPP